MSKTLFEVDVRFAGEGYSLRRVRVLAPSDSTPERVKELAIAKYAEHLTASEPRVVS